MTPVMMPAQLARHSQQCHDAKRAHAMVPVAPQTSAIHHSANLSGSDVLDVISQWCDVPKRTCRSDGQSRDFAGVPVSCMNNIMLPFPLAMTSFFDVIFQCSAVQFVRQHIARLRIRWPCMTRVMLPVYLAMTSFLMSYCNA